MSDRSKQSDSVRGDRVASIHRRQQQLIDSLDALNDRVERALADAVRPAEQADDPAAEA